MKKRDSFLRYRQSQSNIFIDVTASKHPAATVIVTPRAAADCILVTFGTIDPAVAVPNVVDGGGSSSLPQKPGAGKKNSKQIWESGDTGLYQRTRSKSVRTKIQKNEQISRQTTNKFDLWGHSIVIYNFCEIVNRS